MKEDKNKIWLSIAQAKLEQELIKAQELIWWKEQFYGVKHSEKIEDKDKTVKGDDYAEYIIP